MRTIDLHEKIILMQKEIDALREKLQEVTKNNDGNGWTVTQPGEAPLSQSVSPNARGIAGAYDPMFQNKFPPSYL